MTLWICNGAVLKSSSQPQLKEFWKFNNSRHEHPYMPKMMKWISPFPTVDSFLPYSLYLNLSSAKSLSLEKSKSCHFRHFRGNSFLTVDDPRSFCGQCRSNQSDLWSTHSVHIFILDYNWTVSLFRNGSLFSVAENSIYWFSSKRVNPFPNKPWFLCVCSTSL